MKLCTPQDAADQSQDATLIYLPHDAAPKVAGCDEKDGCTDAAQESQDATPEVPMDRALL